MRVNSMRLTGIASGMDTEQMVKDLMKAERSPLNKLLQKKQLEEWKRDTYREFNTLLLDFRNNTTSNLRYESTFLQKKATSSSDTKVGVTVTGQPLATSYNVENVTLAKPATSSTITIKNTLPNGTTKLSDAGGAAFDFTIQGSGGTAKTISVAASDTINDVISKINQTTSESKVKAMYVEASKSIVLVSTATGTSSDINISAADPNILNIVDGDVNDYISSGAGGGPHTGYKGEAATSGSVTINGTVLELHNNTVTYDGIQFNLKEAFAGTVSVDVKTDTDGIFNQIKGFVEKYNELIDKLNKKLSEPKYRDYQPLLEEEREALSEDQIKKWEEKAKSGILKGDTLLNNLVLEMRKGIYTPVSGVSDSKFDVLAEIGISTAPPDSDFAVFNYQENGKLYIDETKLRAAIEENGPKVMELFTKKSGSTDMDTRFKESGVGQRLYDSLKKYIDQITDLAGSSSMSDESEYYEMGKSMRKLNKDIDRWEDRLLQIEDRYWRKFNAMEKALDRLNSQSSWLSQQFGGGGQ